MASILLGLLPAGSVETTFAFVGVSALSGLLAAVAMAVLLSRQEGGFTPAYVVASALRRVPVDDVSSVDAHLVHHGAGVLAGVLYAVVYVVLAATLPPVVATDTVSVLPHVLATVAAVAFVYAAFARVVLPRAAGVHEERSTAVQGLWLRASLVFGLTLVVVSPLFASPL